MVLFNIQPPDRSWIHTDSWNNWAAVLYLTPDAPESSGTGII